MTQREILVELLRNYRTVEATLVRSEAGSGGHIPMMCEAWNASYRELERCLRLLAVQLPGATRMLLARYVDPTVSRRNLIGSRSKSGQVRFANQPAHSEVRSYAQLPDRGHANEWTCVLASWPDWVRTNRVEQALDALEASFKGQAWLPVELLAA